MTVFDRSLAISENPCNEDVDRNLWLPVLDIGSTVLVRGASKRLLSLGLDLQVAPLSISTAIQASPGRIRRRVCEQGCPVPVQALNPNVAARPLGSRHNVHKGTYLNTVEKGYRKGFVRIGQWGEREGDDVTAKPISLVRGGAKAYQQPPTYTTVLYLISRN